MSTVTAVKIPPGEQETLSAGELRAWRGLLRAHACLAKRLDAALDNAHRLPLSSYEVLHHLQDSSGGRMRMCDLAEQAQLSRSGLTRLVDRLEREELLERCSCEQDARGSFACLTDTGRERLEEARVTHLAVVREHFFSRFSEPELSVLADMCQRIAPCNGAETPPAQAAERF
jgi:DNA-binding MarR family transcriptional regulator